MNLPLLWETLYRILPARALLLLCLLTTASARAQEAPYFVTYDHHLEEPGNLEIETSSTTGVPRSGQRLFFAPYIEFEYGVTGRLTSELYLEGQSTSGDGAVFTGWRLENRFRPLKREHWINPVLYLEYEGIKRGQPHHQGDRGPHRDFERAQRHAGSHPRPRTRNQADPFQQPPRLEHRYQFSGGEKPLLERRLRVWLCAGCLAAARQARLGRTVPLVPREFHGWL